MLRFPLSLKILTRLHFPRHHIYFRLTGKISETRNKYEAFPTFGQNPEIPDHVQNNVNINYFNETFDKSIKNIS